MAAQIPGGPLSAANLANLMLQSLPSIEGNQIKTPAEGIALLCHACFLAVDFRLVGLDEEHPIDSKSQSSKALPIEWNQLKHISFTYAHPQSAMKFLLEIRKLGSKIVVNGLAVGDEKVATLDVRYNDFISESHLPYNSGSDITSAAASYKIQQMFITSGRLADFANMLKVQLLQKLVPKLYKEGYEEDASGTEGGGQHAPDGLHAREREQQGRRPQPRGDPPAAIPRPFGDPLADMPRRDQRPYPDFAPPGFEDEHEILRAPGRGGLRGPVFGGIGERDLYPPGLGPHDPLRIGPQRGGTGGMYPTFGELTGQGGQYGGFDPMAPPGARYDPVGPGDGVPRDPTVNRRGPPGPGRGGFGGGFGGPPNPFGGYGGGDFV